MGINPVNTSDSTNGQPEPLRRATGNDNFPAQEGTHPAPQMTTRLLPDVIFAESLHHHLSGNLEEGEHLWGQLAALWSQAWSANYQVLELMQKAGLTRFSPAKPQRWVIASFEHHTSPHGLPQPHVHNIAIPP
jgi:hypothetical protein